MIYKSFYIYLSYAVMLVLISKKIKVILASTKNFILTSYMYVSLQRQRLVINCAF